jgi:H+/gluconate symporter-like permease
MAVSNDKIFDKLIEVSEVVAGIAPVVADLKKAVITGNGTPSLLQRMKSVEDFHETESKTKKDKKENVVKWDTRLWALAVAVFILFAGQVVQLIFK